MGDADGSCDWPLSREEKKRRVMNLYNQELRAANQLLESGEEARTSLMAELGRLSSCARPAMNLQVVLAITARALSLWGNSVLLLHMVLRAWCDDVAAERELVVRAAHDTRMKHVLIKMENRNSGFLAQCIFDTWRDMTKDVKAEAQMSEVTKMEEHIKELHRAHVSQCMFRMANLEELVMLLISLHACLAAWREDVHHVQSQGRTQTQLQEDMTWTQFLAQLLGQYLGQSITCVAGRKPLSSSRA